MTTIAFSIEGEEHRFEFEPVHGDPNVLFREGSSHVAEEIEEMGYAFRRGAEPEYQELARAYRDGPGLDLGDLSDRVERSEPNPAPPEDGIPVELVGPEEETGERWFEPGQNIGAVAAAIGSDHDVGLDERVVLHVGEEEFTNDTPIEKVAGEVLEWEIRDLGGA